MFGMRVYAVSIATHLLDAGADLAFVKDWLGHANIQNTTIYARLTTATLDAQVRTIFSQGGKTDASGARGLFLSRSTEVVHDKGLRRDDAIFVLRR
jgi:hypothetical protein